ncbi:MAG: DUF6134 family protein, partial [Pedobacter sp.]|nr:DUF6134 family protein [Pedobacter sp.]
MIPALLIWFGKKYILPKLQKRKSQAAKPVACLVLIALLACTLSLQAQTKTYQIKRNDQVIGKMLFNQQADGENLYLKITSQVNTRFVFKVDVQTEDLAHFKNGKLISSDVNRTVNGRTKERKKTIFRAEGYQLQCGSKQQSFNKPSIAYNMMLLYSMEPANIGQVYSDNFQCFVPIKKSAPHQYRITLPDGNYNDYFFENGICRLVIVNHSLYT